MQNVFSYPSSVFAMATLKFFYQQLAILLFIFCTGVQAQQNTDRQMAGVKGAVRLVVKGWVESGEKRVIDNSTTYDRKGNEVEVVQYGTDPSRRERLPIDKVVSTFVGLTKTERTYKVKKTTKDGVPSLAGIVVNGKVRPMPPPLPSPIYEPDGAFLQQTVYQLDAQGSWAGKIGYDGRVKKSSVLSRYVYRRNEKGLVEEELVYEGDGSLSARIAHKFNDDGVELEYAEYEPKGTLRMKNTYSDFKLDEKGNWINRTVKMFYVRSDGKPVNTGQNEYREIYYYSTSK